MVLGEWLVRRWRRRRERWRLLLRVSVDWVVFFYIVLPGLAVLGWILWRYEHPARWSPVLAHIALQLHLPVPALISVLLGAALYLAHSIVYGHVAVPLESVDAVWLRLAGVSSRAVMAALWLETCLYSLPGTLSLWVLTLPLTRLSGVGAGTWLLWTLGWCLYEAGLRLAVHARLARSGGRWMIRVGRSLGRYLAYIPSAWSMRLTLSHSHAPASAAAVWLCCGGLVSAVAVVVAASSEWTNLTGDTSMAWIMRWVPEDEDRPSRVRYIFRHLPRRWVRLGERVLGRPLAPVTWLLLSRGLRRMGLLRDLAYISAVAIVATRPAPPVTGWLGLGVFVFLLHQWWSLRVTPLYRAPIAHQLVVEAVLVEQPAKRLRGWLEFLLLVLWAACSGRL